MIFIIFITDILQSSKSKQKQMSQITTTMIRAGNYSLLIKCVLSNLFVLFPCSDANDIPQNLKRKFRQEWQNSFDWLQNKNGTAFCVACSKTLTSHLTHLRAHEKTSLHVTNYNNQKRNLKIQTFFNEDDQAQKKLVRYAELTLVMFCITHNLPFLLMDYLPALLVECCPDSAIAKLIQCGRTKSTQIADIIGKQASDQTLSDLKKKKVSLIVDETTDVSTKKCLVLVARYFDTNFGILDKFLTLIEISKADAISIYNVIKEFFVSFSIPMQNLIGLATDGANVMAGEVGGLKALLCNKNDIFYIKCTCHSLHLCSSYACKQMPNSLESLCRNIYSYFSHSPKRIEELKEFQDYCSVKPHKILGVCQTRWLSLEGVILRIIEQWDSLKLYFISCYYEVQGVKPAHIAEEMTSKVKCYFLFLSYILPIINNLNKEFQSESSRLPYLYASIKTNFLLILSNFVKREYINNNVEIDYKNKANLIDISKIFIGSKAEIFLKANLTDSEIYELKSNVLNFYVEFLDQLKHRFDFKREDIKLLNIITPPRVISSENLDILPLILEFSSLVECDPDFIVTEWNLLRLSETSLSPDLSIDMFWKNVSAIKNGLNEHCFENLVKFVFNLLSLPHSSAAAERKFSSLSLIKSKLRNKLEINTINSIMLCKELITNKGPHTVWSAKKDFKTPNKL